MNERFIPYECFEFFFLDFLTEELYEATYNIYAKIEADSYQELITITAAEYEVVRLTFKM